MRALAAYLALLKLSDTSPLCGAGLSEGFQTSKVREPLEDVHSPDSVGSSRLLKLKL